MADIIKLPERIEYGECGCSCDTFRLRVKIDPTSDHPWVLGLECANPKCLCYAELEQDTPPDSIIPSQTDR